MWEMTINLKAPGFESLKSNAKGVLEAVVRANTYKQLPVMGSSTCGRSQTSYSVTYQCPVEEEIKSLRAEADKLEKTLGQS